MISRFAEPLNELYIPTCDEGEIEWRETARWIKYEENLEFGADRWGKPHVPSLSFHDLLQLRQYFENGVVSLDVIAPDLHALAGNVTQELVGTERLNAENASLVHQTIILLERADKGNQRSHIKSVNSLQHFYYKQQLPIDSLDEKPKRKKSSGIHLAHAVLEISQAASVFSLRNDRISNPRNSAKERIMAMLENAAKSNENCQTKFVKSEGRLISRITNICHRKAAERGSGKLFKNLPKGSEAAVIMVGALEFIHQPIMVFLRLADALNLQGEKDLPLPVRFVFILIGPLNAGPDYHEIGRAMGTLLSQKEFRHQAYTASCKQGFLHGINEFLDQSIVLPPGRWEQKELFSLDKIKMKSKWLRQRKSAHTGRPLQLDEIIALKAQEFHTDPLIRSGKLFAGLRKEVRRFPKHYGSDLIDGLNWKSFTAVVFIFCVCFIPCLTFGAILDTKTDGWMGVKETLVATSAGGMVFALLSTQPLLLVGVTGPMLVFEQSLFMFCKAINAAFLEVRFWTSVWCFLICVVMVGLEGSFLIQYLTRFSDDILSTLVSAIFIYETFLFMKKIFSLHPVISLSDYCNQTVTTNLSLGSLDHRSLPHLGDYGSTYPTFRDISSVKHPNTAMLTAILVLGTFAIAYLLHSFQNSKLMSKKLRKMVGNLSLSCAVTLMIGVDWLVLHNANVTNQLGANSILQPTRSTDRGWRIEVGGAKDLLLLLGSAASGFLFFLVLFVETEAAELELSEMKPPLRKGTGYHWDLLVSGALAVACGLFGLPWLCPAGVQSKEHMASLTLFRTQAPGQRPQPSGVVDQRVTSFVLSFLIGLSLLATDLIDNIPVGVLFGVFLYLGVGTLKGIQLLERSVLFFIPVKYHPTTPYCLRVRTHRMHLYTSIQLISLIFVTTIKSVKITAFAFPFGIMITVLLRHFGLPKIFSKVELIALDGDESDDETDE